MKMRVAGNRTFFFFWNVRSVPIGSMGLVYYLHSVDVYIVWGKCRYIYHTWILWSEVVNYTLRILTPKSLCLRLGTYTPVLYRFKPFHSRVQGFLGYIVLRCDHCSLVLSPIGSMGLASPMDGMGIMGILLDKKKAASYNGAMWISARWLYIYNQLGCIPNPENNGRSTTNLNWWVYRISEPSTVCH